MNLKSLVKQMLTERENRKYEKRLQSRRMSYEEWCRSREEQVGASSGRERDSAAEADSYVLYVSDKGVLAKNAEEMIGAYFAAHPEVQIVYGDEDVWENFPRGERRMPWFKPDWSPDLFESCFYFGGAAAVRRELYDRAQSDGLIEIQALRRCVQLAGGYERGCRSIGHLSEILFHRDSEESIWHGCRSYEALSALAEGGKAEEKSKDNPEEKPLISMIIPSKDHPEILASCLKAIPKVMGRTACEVIVVDNGSSGENRAAVHGMLEGLQKNETCEITAHYLYQPMEFNFSKMCNLGAEKAAGDFLLFLNDDVELCTENSVEQMCRLAGRSYTGAVGMKLYYPDSVKIQHAGITYLPMGPVHKLQFLEDTVSYYFDSNRGNRNMLAVTAACLMVEKKKFQEAGGFCEELRVAFNDVDFCFRLWELGYANVCMNDIYAWHHESLSRGDDESEEKLNRLLAERELLEQRHGELRGYDPYYSVHLSRQGLDTRIRPAYETAGNTVQNCAGEPEEKSFRDYRQDNCLLVRVESVQDGVISGYCVVLGDNNACYENMLLLRREESGDSFTGENETKEAKQPCGYSCMALPLEGQYRPDLAENMPDQKNVALCGFRIKIAETMLPKGTYRIGAAARNRVTGTKLMNWTNYRLQ